MSRLKKNVISGVSKQIIAILYGFILPRLILIAYGSKANGLVSSISQFLTLISCLDLGVNVVIQAALYKPLATKDERAISEIMVSARKFFRLLARILIIYVVALAIIYPLTVEPEYGLLYIVTLILSLSIGSFAEFYFGIVNSTLLKADQKVYIYDWLSVLVYVLTIIASYLLIRLDCSIQGVKLATSLVFLIRPVYISIYVKNHYNIDYHVEYEDEPIKQKWNGMAQHFSAIVIDSTDIIVLTIFSTLQNVSIYSVYNLVVTGIKSLVLSVTHGLSAHFGSIIAQGNRERIYNSFAQMEWVIHTITIIVFGCTSVLIVPFVKLYTIGVNDTDYVVPLFAMLITLAQMMRCIRLPYNIMILAAGHFKQTQNNYIYAAILNIGSSVLLVIRYGLVGVAIGTILAFIYQVLWMAWYISNNVVYWPFLSFVRQSLTDILIFIIAFLVAHSIPFTGSNYFSWSVYASIVLLIWISISSVVNYFLYREPMMQLVKKIKR